LDRPHAALSSSTTLFRSPRLVALIARGDEAARRMGLYLLDDRQKNELYSAHMRDAVAGVTTEGLIRSVLNRARSFAGHRADKDRSEEHTSELQSRYQLVC